jgi:hypothetical protein
MKFVLLRSLWRGASSQKVSKNPKIYCIHSSLPKNAKSRFGFLGLLGVNVLWIIFVGLWWYVWNSKCDITLVPLGRVNYDRSVI